MTSQAVFIDPSSDHFLNDRLFDLDNQHLNRDGTLIPFARLRDHFAKQGIPVHTADKLRDGSERREINHYWSLGLLNGYESFLADSAVRLRGFILFEPPLVQSKMYQALPRLTAHFDQVHVHNTVGDGYSLDGVIQGRLRQLYWPQPYGDVLNEYWHKQNRLNKLVAIASNHNPWLRKPELYSERIKAIATLSDRNGVDLFGRGWDRWWSRQSFWGAYWRHRSKLLLSYQGSCVSKWEVLSNYRFSLCFENMPMRGYLTEKLFDCLYTGTVPVYWGAKDIEALVPSNAFVDMRNFRNYEEMFEYITSVSNLKWNLMREAGREFLLNNASITYKDSLINMIEL